jgi:hypothetical protein
MVSNSGVRKFRRLVRIILTIVALAIVVVTAIQIEQRMLRVRAQRLLDGVRSLELRKSSYEETARFLADWNRWVQYDGPCSAAECSAAIDLNDFFVSHLGVLLYKLNFMRPYLLLGGLPSQVRARVGVRDGVLCSKSFLVAVEVPEYTDQQGDFGRYTLIGDAETISRSDILNYRTAGMRGHPEYLIGKPGGCDGPCLEVHAKFTPYADPADVRRLMQFDLSCLTRMVHPCRREGDIMPAAWTQYLKEADLKQ